MDIILIFVIPLAALLILENLVASDEHKKYLEELDEQSANLKSRKK